MINVCHYTLAIVRQSLQTRRLQQGKKPVFFALKKSPRPSDQSGPVSKCDARQTAAQIGSLLCQNFKVQICKKITIEKTPGSKKPKIHFLFFQQSLLTIPKEVETI